MKKLFWVLTVLIITIAIVTVGCKKEPAALTVEIFDRGTEDGRTTAYDNAWTSWIKNKVKKDLNIDLTFIPVNYLSEKTDIKNLMMSGSAPDLCYTYSEDLIAGFLDQGGFLDLAPYINSRLPDLKKLLGDDPAFPGRDFIYRNADPQTGKIYSIHSYRTSLAQRNIFIRKDWLDKINFPLPTNIEELYNALIAFRDRDPGGVKRNNVVPLGAGGANWGLADFINNFIDPNSSDRDRWVYDIYDRRLMMPGYKEGVRLMNQWYYELLIYKDFHLTADEDFYSLIKSGVVGAFCQDWDLPYRTDYNINEELAANVPGAEFVPVDIFQNKEMMDKAGLHIFIPAFSMNHIAALRYLNWLAKPENYHFLQFGQEGVNHTIVNGVPNTIERPTGDPWFMNSANNIDYTMPMNGTETGSPELNARVLASSYGNTPPDVIVNAYMISTRNARAAAVYQAAITVNQYARILQDKADQLITQAIICNPRDFDRIWDDGIRDWLASGGQEAINERASLYK
jgi:putative aldouronate transport system substrate-binding protein